MKNKLLMLAFLLFSTLGVAQIATPIRSVSSLPASCSGGSASKVTDEVELISGGVGKKCTCNAPNTWSCGVVTSVGITVPSGLNVSPSTITTAGSFAITWVSAIPHAQLPTLVSGDIPWATPGIIGSSVPSSALFTTLTAATSVTSNQFCFPGSCITSWPTGSGAGTITEVDTASPLTGGPITSGTVPLGCATCVVSTTPGAGLGHFAGGSQVMTSSAVNLASADVTGLLPDSKLATSGATAGNYTCSNITASNQGIITAITSGCLINAIAQYGAPYFSGSGTSTTLGGMAPPTTNGHYVYDWNITGSAAAAPDILAAVGGGTNPLYATVTSPAAGQVFVYNTSGVLVNAFPGINVGPQTGNYTLTCPTDRFGEIDYNLTSATATLTLPVAGGTACTQNGMAFVVRNAPTSLFVLTILSTSPSVFLPENKSSYTILPGSGMFVYSDAVTTTGSYHAMEIPAVFGGINTQASSYTITATDRNKMVMMNCSATCTVTLPAAPPDGKWTVWLDSVGSVLPTVSLNGLTFNTSASVPVLNSFIPLMIRTDASNYYGTPPLIAGTNMTITSASNGTTFTSSGGGGGGGALNGVTGAVAAATATEVVAGDVWTYGGVETTNLTTPIVFTNANSSNNNSSGAIMIGTSGTSTGAVPLRIFELTAGGDFVDFYTGGSYSAGVYTPGTLKAGITTTGIQSVGGYGGTTTNQSTVYQGGQDGSTISGNSTTFRGANHVATSGTSEQSGVVLIQGGNNNQTASSSAVKGGDLSIIGGLLSNATPGAAAIEGMTTYDAGYKGAGTLNTLACYNGTSQTIATCSSVANNHLWFGVIQQTAGGSQGVTILGDVLLTFDGSFTGTSGDIVCTSPNTGGDALDYGTLPCPNTRDYIGHLKYQASAGTTAIITIDHTPQASVITGLPGSIRTSGLQANVSTATLCAATAGACNVSGTYHVHAAFYQSGTACSANSSNGVSFLLTWVDPFGTSHSAQTMLLDTSAGSVAGTMAWNNNTLGAWASGDMNIDTNGSVIQYATAYANCGTGTATYAVSATVTRLQ